jgi:hypothetical protein
LARPTGDHHNGVDGNEADDGESEEIGVDWKKGRGLEFAVPSEFVVGELFSRSLYFFLHEKKLLHPSQFLGISGSRENPTDVVDRETRLPRRS